MAESVSQGGAQAFNDAVNAPVAGFASQQNNAPEGVAVRTGYQGTTNLKIDRSIEDSRNFGVQVTGNKIGAGGSLVIETLDDEVALGALQSNIEVSRDALETNRQTSLFAMQSNLDATRAAIDGTVNVAGEAFAFGGGAVDRAFAFGDRVADSLDQASRQQYVATIETINAANQTAQQAGATSEAIVRDALGKLAEQRAPEGVNLTRALTFIAIAAAAAWVLVSIFRRRSAK